MGQNGNGQSALNAIHLRSPAESGLNQAGERSKGNATHANHSTATTSQVRALHAIATRQGFSLTELLREQFKLYRAEELSISEASRLIDDLNTEAAPVGASSAGGHA